jgi:superfamily II DNA or RNA helicase
MPDVIVGAKLDDVHMQLSCEAGIMQELRDYFTFEMPGARFSPAYKARKWDGKIRLCSSFGIIPTGLAPAVAQFAKDRDYESSFAFLAKPKEVNLDSFILDLKLPEAKAPRVYQVDALRSVIDNERVVLISPTASGKSLIIYMIAQWFYDDPTLIIVPTINLVKQMRSDFIEYGMNPDDIAIIMGGEEKNVNARVVISTWQSATALPPKWFARYRQVIGDEAHLFKAKELEKVMGNLKNCPVRVGTTGTLDGSKVNQMVLEGIFGEVFVVETTRSLMDQGFISELKTRCILLSYSDEIKKIACKLDYQTEINFLCSYAPRNKFIVDLTMSLEGNTLVMFNYIEKHGDVLHKLILEAAKDTGRSVHYIHGSVDGDEREEIRNIVNQEKGAIILGSFGTMQLGVNIPNIHNAVCASPSKSVIRILQSIGRTLRLGEEGSGKSHATWYDIADDLSWKKKSNHTLKHFSARLSIYDKERFVYKIFQKRI